MAKKVFAWLGIALAAVVLFFVVCICILFLAPGTELFGIRYIAHGISNYEQNNVSLADLTSKDLFSGNIYIETYGVPIKIQYTTYFSTHLSFKQEFIGLTRSKAKKANLSVVIDDDDNLRITTTEIVPWLYSYKAAEGENYYMELMLDTRLKDRDLYINSTKSKVNIIGNPTYDNFVCNTSEALTIDGSITATSFTYHTEKEIEIADKVSAVNYDLSSSMNDITITKPVEGDLKLATKGGDIKFISCKNLEATTQSGDITHYGEGLSSVAEKVKISTRSGVISLGNVGLNLEDTTKTLEINSVSGNVNITSMVDGTIVAERGKVNVGACRNVIITANTGDVVVNTASNGVVVNGRNGKVRLGENGEVNNPYVTTTTGTISAENTTGVVYLYSSSNAVTIKNKTSNKLTLHAGRALSATGLSGEVSAYANGNVSMTFANVTGNVTVNVGTRCNKVDIDATCVSYDYVNYSLRSTKGKKASVFASGELLVTPASVLESGTMVEDLNTIKVEGSYAEINLYLSAV